MTWRNNEQPTEDLVEKAYNLAHKASPKWFYDEVEEDLDNLASTLESFGIVVHRPEPFDFSEMYGTHSGKVPATMFTIQETFIYSWQHSN